MDFNKVNERNVTKREMNKQESLEQKKAEKKAAKKQEKKEIKRAAAAASVSRMLETKKNISKELRGEQELTGDLLVDGNSGLTKTICKKLFRKSWKKNRENSWLISNEDSSRYIRINMAFIIGCSTCIACCGFYFLFGRS